MSAVQIISVAILCPAAVGLLALAAPRRFIGLRVASAALAPAASLALLAFHVHRHGVDAGAAGVPWMPTLNLDVAFHADRLGLFFASLVASVGVLIVLYARAYFGPDQSVLRRFYPSLLLFITAMLGLVLADNFILLLLFWELTSVTSFVLIGWERDDPPAVRNAMQAFMVTGVGGLALLGGLVLLGVTTGIWTFSELAATGLVGSNVTGSSGMIVAAFVLIFIGAAAKSAQWPLHFWLPSAMAAPTPVSAYLHSATMVKAGVYLLARIAAPMAELDIWPLLLVPVGAITMVLGAYIAFRKTDLKLIFAYTTVSQLGLLVCMYGLSALGDQTHPALIWDVTQILNHATYKAPLFIVAGAIAHITYTRDIRNLHGLFNQGRLERLLAILVLLGAYALASGPFTLGFVAKEFFFYGIYHAYQTSHHPGLIAVMAAGVCQGALNVAILVRLARVFLSPETSEALEPPADPEAEEDRIAYEDYHAIQAGLWPRMLWVPAAIILGVQYLGGVAPALFDRLFGRLERSRVYFEHLPGAWEMIARPGLPLALSALAIVLGLALGFSPFWRRNIRDRHDRLFPLFLALATKGGGRLFRRLQTGNFRTYFAVVCAALVFFVCWAGRLMPPGSWLPAATQNEPFGDLLPAILLAVLACGAGVLLPMTRVRAGRVMVLGTVGFTVAGIFYLYNAPDVALTQMTIEIVSLILFLLVLSLLPPTVTPGRHGRVILRTTIAAAVGLVMFWLTLSGGSAQRKPLPYLNAEGQPFAHLGEFFLRNAYTGIDTVGRHQGGGGNNVVNVILVDFRGFDTFGEITVVALATLGVWMLLRRRSGHPQGLTLGLARARLTQESAPLTPETTTTAQPLNRPPRTIHRWGASSEPLRIVSKLLVPLSLLFSLYIFFKGHQSPGGGFVAGLVAAIALLVHRMANGRASLRRMVWLRERTLISGGLLLALATGAGPMLFGKPFLSSAFGYLRLPGTDNHVAWATVLGFDLGVFMVVLGVVMGLINALSEEVEEQ